MEKEILNTLNKWAVYSKYDRNQRKFNLANYEYQMHTINKKIEKLLAEYDESGILSIITIKLLFQEIMEKSKISLKSYLESSDNLWNDLQEDREIYTSLYSKEVIDMENAYFSNISKLIQKVIGTKLIGEENIEIFKNKIAICTEKVINGLEKCRLDVYKKGGVVKQITKFSTQIFIFSSIAECLLALDNSEDGMYLTYIDIQQSPDSFFGFFVKSNGNLFSFSERIPEAYKGSHQHSRNGRWTEAKADDIFPYEFIFKYSNYDYKGYSTTYEINEEKLQFLKLGEDAYIPLLLAMILVAKKFSEKELNDEISYIDSLLPENISLLTTKGTELSVINKNEIVEAHKYINLDFDSKKVLECAYDNEFLNNRKLIGNNKNQMFVDMYGEGFQIDMKSILTIPSDLKLLSDRQEKYLPEFVGTEEEHRTQVFYMIRQQLAEHIRKKMYEEYIKFGGIKAYQKWYHEAINNNLEHIEDIIATRYKNHSEENSQFTRTGWNSINDNIKIDIWFEENVSYPENGWGYYKVNKVDRYKSLFFDMRNDAKCSIFFTIRPKNYEGLQELFGDIPKLLIGWCLSGHRSSGNSILNMTDAVEDVGTPFEDNEANRYHKMGCENPSENFSFIIGYSKRGFKQMLKERE